MFKICLVNEIRLEVESTNHEDIGTLYILYGAVAGLGLVYYYLDLILNNRLDYNIIELILYFYNSSIYFIRIKLGNIFSKQEGKNNLFFKRHYTSLQKFSENVEDQYKKGMVKLDNKNWEENVKQFKNIIRHPIIINKIKREDVYLKIEFSNMTTKNKIIRNSIIDVDGKNKELIFDVIEINKKPYIGVPKVVYKYEYKLKEDEKIEDVIKEDKDFYSNEEKEKIVNNIVEEINKNKEEIEVIDMNKLKLEGRYKGEFTKNESYEDLMNSIK